MPSLFKKLENRTYDMNHRLIDYQQKDIKYNINDGGHNALIKDCTLEVKKTLAALQNIDKKIVIGYGVSIISTVLAVVFPLMGLLSTASFIYASVQVGKRAAAQKEYEEALSNLIECCHWSLGDGKQEAAAMEKDPLNDMIATLSPLTSAEQMNALVAKKHASPQADKLRENVVIYDKILNKEQSEVYRNFYGYEKGGVLDVLKSFLYAAKTGFSKMGDYLSAKINKPDEGAVVPAGPAPAA